MSALEHAVLKSGTNKKDTGSSRLSGLHRGEIVNVINGHAWFTLPRVSGDQVHGPYPVLASGIAVGNKVLVGAIDGRIDDLAVLNKI